jgi:hypothetical protein
MQVLAVSKLALFSASKECPTKQLTETIRCDVERRLPSRGLATLGLLRRGDDEGRPSDPLGVGAGLLEDPLILWSSSKLLMGPSLPRVDRP